MMILQTKKEIILFVFIAFLGSCTFSDQEKDKVWSDLPAVTNLTELKQTEFVATLENPISPEKNVIYAPAFLFAWDKIVEELKSQIVVSDTNSNDFRLLAASKSHINSLTDSEYSDSAIVDDGLIVARAFFNKTLPFETELQLLPEPILFDKKTNVVAFGMKNFDEDAIKFTKILYYQDDDNFILQLTPGDKQYEILLVKGLSKYKTLSEALGLKNILIEKGKKGKADSTQSWKYEIFEGDIFAIPIIKFNIQTDYKNIEGQTFLTKDNKKHFVEEAYQRTGFILNENGAAVESEAILVVDSAGPEPVIHPKSMVFDTPFLVIVKRKEQENPAFVMTINNSELLTKK
jgi:hypothetical protein